jgi:hypothetical protein
MLAFFGWLTYLAAVPLLIAGLITGIISRDTVQGLVGLVLSIIGLGLWLLFLIFVIVILIIILSVF